MWIFCVIVCVCLSVCVCVCLRVCYSLHVCFCFDKDRATPPLTPGTSVCPCWLTVVRSSRERTVTLQPVYTAQTPLVNVCHSHDQTLSDREAESGAKLWMFKPHGKKSLFEFFFKLYCCLKNSCQKVKSVWRCCGQMCCIWTHLVYELASVRRWWWI